MTRGKVVSVTSGGLDSVSFLIWYKKKDFDVEVITYNYGQKAQRELERLKEICSKYSIPVKEIDMTFMKALWKGTQLTDDTTPVANEYTPSVVVPLRNGVMLAIAFSYAYTIKADIVIYGSHKGDIGQFTHDKCHGAEYFYPDCSPEFAASFAKAMKDGVYICDQKVIIDTPGMKGWDKSMLLKNGFEVMGADIFRTWSCYSNGEKQCGVCESCRNRKQSFKIANIEDKTEYVG